MNVIQYRYSASAYRLRHIALLLLLSTVCGVASSSSDSRAARMNSFSVRDSIEMTTFSDPNTRSPDAKCKLSPDGKHFFVITTKGVLSTNRLRSSIWLYATVQVVDFLHSKNAIAPKPQLVWQDDAVPKADQFDSYGSLITKAQWSSDSTAVLFLAENGDGIRRLYRLDIPNGRLKLLSTSSADIKDFVAAASTTIYISHSEDRAKAHVDVGAIGSRGDVILTGRSLLNIFDPATFSKTGTATQASDLWETHGNHSTALNETHGPDEWHYPMSASAVFHLALSPDGRGLIAARPVLQVQPMWRQFVSVQHDFDFKKLPAREAKADRDWLWPWQYLYIDLQHHLEIPVANAPTAWMAGYGEPYEAYWSHDSSRVLVTGTYLVTTGSAAIDRDTPCSVAVFAVESRSIRCVVYTRYPKEQSHLRSARFGASPHEVVLQWSTEGELTQEVYQEESGSWLMVNASPPTTEKRESLTVSIRQGLNEVPSLWATDPKTGDSKQLWDPNPQLAAKNIGQASVFHWTDDSGYEWKAGLVKPYGYVPGHRYPLVIQTHGFDEHEFLVDGSYTTGFAAQPLAASGIMILQMEDRSDRHQKGMAEEATLFAGGCAAAIRQMTEDGLIDPSKVGIIGFSRSSWYVETALEQFPQLFKAATIIDGVDQSYVSYILLCAGMPSCKDEPEAVNGGPPFGRNLSGWLNSAPNFNLDKLHAVLRIEAINWYSIFEEWEIYSSLFQQGKPVDLTYIPEGQHILQEPKQRYASQQGDVDWFRFWLQGYKRPNPEDSDQYKRWEHLRELRDAGAKNTSETATSIAKPN